MNLGKTPICPALYALVGFDFEIEAYRSTEIEGYRSTASNSGMVGMLCWAQLQWGGTIETDELQMTMESIDLRLDRY